MLPVGYWHIGEFLIEKGSAEISTNKQVKCLYSSALPLTAR